MRIEHNSQMSFYRSPFGAVTCGTHVRLRLGVAEGGLPNSIRVHYQFLDEKYFHNMSYIYDVGGMCIYETELILPNRVGLLHYYFEVINTSGKFFYSTMQDGLGGLGTIYPEKPHNAYQITIYDASYKTPEWFRNSVVYQIFPDRFYNGNEDGTPLDKRTDVIRRNWGDTPYYKAEQFGGEYKSNDFFGGNLKGITKKLTYLAELGISAIYLNPIFKAYSNHKYDTGNYMQIDPAFGDEADFCRLCEKADELGIKIILDGVFNHTGSNSIYFNKDNEYDSIGAYQSEKSPYYDWYSFGNSHDEYDSWWGMKTLPAINEKSNSFRSYILNSDDSVVRHWLKKGASGWRLDVVDELPGFFVKELRKAVKSLDNDAVIIGEVWEDASNKCSYGEQKEYFLGKELDSVMNYPLRSAFISFAKNDIDAFEFDRRIMSLKEHYPKPAYYSLLNFLSSHDVERILTAVSNAPQRDSVDKDFMATFRLDGDELSLAQRRVRQIVTMLMLMPGVPCIYYGDERGMQGYADPFCRGCVDWEHYNADMRLWYSVAVALRKSSDCFVDGEFECIYKLNYGYGFIRYLGDEKHIVLSNFGENTEWFRIDIARFSVHELELENGLYEEYYNSEDGIYYIEMHPGDVKVFKGRS